MDQTIKKRKFEYIPPDFYKTIHKLYNLSYLQKHSSDIMISILIFVFFLLGISYCYIKINSKDIVNDWNNQKCKPGIMPFAGIINPPTDGTSATDFTINNFKECLNGIFSDIANDAITPVNYVIDIIKDFFKLIESLINSIRKFVDYIRSAAQNIFQEIMGKLLNIFVGIQQFMISMKDLFSKIQGIMTSGLYLSVTTYYTMKSSIGAFYELIVIILLIMAAIIIVLWIIPVTWGAAAAGLVIFLAISIPLAIIAAVMAEAFDLSLSGMPGAPTCFAENTKVEMNDGSYKNIQNIKPNEILKNNNKVISTFKCLSKFEKFYKINNTILSGSHYILINNNPILVSDYKNAISVTYNNEYTYCLSTERKEIEVDENIYLDFDDIKSEKYRKLHNLNKNVDCGFRENTQIKMLDGSNKSIKNIKLGDILLDNNIVLGVVTMDSKNISNKFYILNGNLVHENNMYYLDNQLKYISKNYNIITVDLDEKLYHLVTSKNYFYVENLRLLHYSDLIDIYIKNLN